MRRQWIEARAGSLRRSSAWSGTLGSATLLLLSACSPSASSSGSGSGGTEPGPLADFSAQPSAGPAPLQVSFQDLSSGDATSWSWDFGDGTDSAEPSPTHSYASEGTYTVELTVGNALGTDTKTSVGLIAVAPPVAPDFAIRYGMNASENVWSQRGIAFADAMARASEFCRVVRGSLTSEPAPLLPLDASPARLGAGWPDFAALAPGELAGARLFGNMAGSTPDGRSQPYVLTWEGTGSCRLAGPMVVSERNRTPNRVEVLVDPMQGGGDSLLAWILDSSSAADPVRAAHVWLPGMESTRPILWPPFVEKLRAMNGGRGPSTWRAMDWNHVNHYGRRDGPAPFVFDLAGRITPASPSQGTRRGVCPEFVVALCNSLGIDLHFCLPHPANGIPDGDYERFVRATLRVLRDGSPAVPGVNGGRAFAGLDPGLTLTLEYSNELWNPSFPVNNWLKSQASIGGISLHEAIARELGRVFTIADEVFSGSDERRLRKFVGGWIADADFLRRVLDALDPGLRVDALGPAGYFRPRPRDVDAWLAGATPGSCPNCPTPEEVVESGRLTIQELRAKVRAHRRLADDQRNPDGTTPALELYEAGQSFVAGFQPWGAAALQAQALPSLFDAYVLDLVPLLVEEGVDEVLWYSFVADDSARGDGAGPFGHWNSMDQTITLPVRLPYRDEGAPKAAAIHKLPPLRP